jgi:hypothetical protein
MQDYPVAFFPPFSGNGFLQFFGPSYPLRPLESIFSGLKFCKYAYSASEAAEGKEKFSVIGRLFDEDPRGIEPPNIQEG